MARTTFKVALSLVLDSTPRRNILSGLFRQASRKYDWNISVLPTEAPFTVETVRQLAAQGFDGCILTRADDTATREALIRAPFRTILLESSSAATPSPRGNLAYYDNEPAAQLTGSTGCDHLHSCGNFRTFAFVPAAQRASWSTNREIGFLNRARELGLETIPCTINPDDPAALAAWLTDLPKPVALMAACDRLGVQVLDACRNSSIRAPEHVCVLGVDDDVLLNENARPTLSSLRIDLEGIGASIADALQTSMQHPRKAAANCRLTQSVTRVVERDSTRPPVPAAQLIRKALAFIEANATRGIRTDDVVRHLGISRRLAFLRFAELHGKPIATVIRERKLAEVCRKLRSTRLTARQIATSCGFASIRPLECLFRKRYGCTMSAYRAGRSSSDASKRSAAHG